MRNKRKWLLIRYFIVRTLVTMKRIVFSVVLVFLLVSGLLAQRTSWTIGTARTVPKGEAEFGILHPLQIGLGDHLEIQTSPLLTLSLAPNLTVKPRWYTSETWLIASRHRYSMPTMLLRGMGDTGWFTNSAITDTVNYPYIFTLGTDGLFTRRLGKELIVTGRVGTDFALKFKGDSMPPVTHPLLYPRTAIYNNKFVWNVGILVDGNIVREHNFRADISFYSIGLGIDDWALEHRAFYIYNKSISFAAMLGYKLSYASFPADRRFFISPAIDLIWKINAKPDVSTDLFRR